MPIIVKHPWGFFLPDNSRLLMLGSFPPPEKRWSMDFYYPNIQNDMWRIIGVVFYNDKNFFLETDKSFSKEKAVHFCLERGIALGDTVEEAIRLKDNASDNFLQVVKAFNIRKILSALHSCKSIAVTGEKSLEVLCDTFHDIDKPPVGSYSTLDFSGRQIRLYRMPSSSRAYPKSLPWKAEVYRKMFYEVLS